jgi:hypothetical protein
MATKSSQLQIRVTPAQKTALRRLARDAGLDVSGYVLARTLPNHTAGFATLLRELRDEKRRTGALAELNDLLSSIGTGEFADAFRSADLSHLSQLDRNYVAAMVEQACHLRNIAPPRWTKDVAPLDEPWFATSLKSLRLHLLRASPVVFTRRNLFVDSSIGDRV